MARRNAKREDEKYGVLRDISSNWSPTKAARLLVEFADREYLRDVRRERDGWGAFPLHPGSFPYGESAYSEDEYGSLAEEGLRKTWWAEGGNLHVVSPEMWEVVCAAERTLVSEDVQGSPWGESGALLLPHPHTSPRHSDAVSAITWHTGILGDETPLFLKLWAPGRKLHQQGSVNLLGYHTLDEVLLEQTNRDLYPFRLLFAYFRLAEQRTTAETVERVPADPGTPKRAPRPEQDVRVTYLRRSASPAPEGEKRVVDWDHRWVVSMHKARQWYPKEKKHKIIFRGPYVKGPADKPIRTTPTVRALVR